MAQGATTDMIMRFYSAASVGVPAECNLDISANDKIALAAQLSGGFTAGNSLDYFLVSQFAFGAEIRDSESGASAKNPTSGSTPSGHGGGPVRPGQSTQGRTPHNDAPSTRAGSLGRTADHFGDTGGGSRGTGAGGAGGTGGTGSGSSAQFARWRSATDDSWKAAGTYPAYINDFSFTRLIDQATPILFDYCCKKKNFPFVTFIKRKAAMGRASMSLTSSASGFEELTYLRIDLADVLITDISWSDGDIVQESCKIKCQKMRVIYSQQNADGTLVPGTSVDWSSPVIKPPT